MKKYNLYFVLLISFFLIVIPNIKAQISVRQVCSDVVILFSPGGAGLQNSLDGSCPGNNYKCIVEGVIEILNNNGYNVPTVESLARSTEDIKLTDLASDIKNNFPETAPIAANLVSDYVTNDNCVLIIGHSAGSAFAISTMENLPAASYPEVFSIGFGGPKSANAPKRAAADYRAFHYNHFKDPVAAESNLAILWSIMTGDESWLGHQYQWGGTIGWECDTPDAADDPEKECVNFDEFKEQVTNFVNSAFPPLSTRGATVIPVVKDQLLTPKDSRGSCPYLYSITTKGKSFEEDILVNQYGPKQDWPYFSKLDNFDSKIGKIMVSEPLDETSYLDNIKLIRAMHKLGSTAMIDEEGNIITYRNTRSVKCTAKDEIDCTRLVKSKDSNYISPSSDVREMEVLDPKEIGEHTYSTNLMNVNLEDENTLTDYIELEIPKTDAKKIKLLISYGMHPSAGKFESSIAYNLGDMISLVENLLHTETFSNFVKKMNLNIGYSQIMVLNESGKWVPYSINSGFILNSYTQKDTFILLDPSKIKDSKIRLEFTSGLFIFDYIAVSTDESEVNNIQYLDLVSINDSSYEKEHLVSKDFKYVILDKGDNIELEYLIPKEEEGFAYTYFAESYGYYFPYKQESNRTSLENAKFYLDFFYEKNYAKKYLIKLIKES